MGWTPAIAMLALFPQAALGNPSSPTAKVAKISDQVNCAASFIDGRWKSQSIRQFQMFRWRIHEVIGSSIGPGAADRFFVFGENGETIIFFMSTAECTNAANALASAKLFPKAGRILSTSNARARARVVFQEM